MGITTKQELELSPPTRSINITIVNKALSNYDLMTWIDKLKIKRFRDIFSRDNLLKKIKKECGIINLDSSIGSGTHWVCCRNIDEYCEYFDPFGLIMSVEVKTHLLTSGKQIINSRDKIQERNSICFMWILVSLPFI